MDKVRFMPNPAQEAWLRHLQHDLDARREQHLWRELRSLAYVPGTDGTEIISDSRRMVQFCSNNYLGLATHPDAIEAAREAAAKLGTGAGASRLVAGSMAIHHELETALARFKRTEAALVFPTGFMANLAVLTTFAGEKDLVVSDKLNHASLLDAAKFSGAMHRTFPHRNYARAHALLEKLPQEPADGDSVGRKYFVTDSVFSMDGDIADLPAVCDTAEEAGAIVVIDEAHGTGVLGERGAGLAELQQVEKRIGITVGTLSKALGSVGGFVAGAREVIETLVNKARSFIYTTALPPACAAAALVALKVVENEPGRRARVLKLAQHVRRELCAMGYSCGDSMSPIVPVILGDPAMALKGAAFLKERGLFVPAIRPPTVPPNTARLRISLMATHTDGQVEQLLEAMREMKK
jgi:8-amino-7-oxononanoate synthase